ncbi:assimilatory sulfite reductase (NADPH) flavoprotein subunit [Buchnera aphidicola]|uniref:assimilatory sulfite reductase (NADPH) flavoprotein subunit n=1 Tax=Buchnera aphidicola TaxID=9 RepID=UPI0031B8277A
MKDKFICNNFYPLSKEKMKILDNITNNLSNNEISWISGYLWGFSNKINDKNNSIVNETCNIIIMYASQTGNSRLLAEKLYKKFLNLKISVKLFNVYEYKFRNIVNENFFILIISTHGEGEVPDNAFSFYKYLFSNKIKKLNNFYYSVFGLGDKSYEYFCKAGKDFDSRFSKLGGISLLPRVDADIDYKDIFNNWMNKILKIIKKKSKNFNFKNNFSLNNNKIILNKYTKNNPFKANVLINQKITGRNSKKDIYHIEIDLMNSNIKYSPGDALGVWFENDSSLILKILNLLNISKNDLVVYKNKKIKIFLLLKKKYELTVNNFNVTKKYFKYIKNNFIINTLKSNILKLKKYSRYTPIIDMIRYFPINITAEKLLCILRPLTPRLYSISSSQSESDNEIHITVSLVKYIYENFLRFGGSSFYLSNLLQEKKIKIYIVENDNFRLPKDDNASIIMVGAGTGIAPFRSFMQERFFRNAKGKNWLFFGNQSFTEDFLYQLEWQKYYDLGFLTKIDLTWSRDLNNKEKYIQQKIDYRGKILWKWIKKGSYIYICGNAQKMAKEVEKSLLNIFIIYGKMNFDQACNYLNKLKNKKRYQRDIY